MSGAAAHTGEAAGPQLDVTSGKTNERGIPGCKFIDDIGAFIREHSTNTETVIGALHTLHTKYKTMELHLLENRKRIQTKLPDLEKSLAVVNMLQKKKEDGESMQTRFNLADNVFANAEVSPDDRVCVWLGAEVMLEYSYAEAEEMLTKRIEEAKAKEIELKEDLSWLRENIIIAEVNTSRSFNYDVRRRRAAGEDTDVLKNDDFFEATGNKNLDCQNNNNIPTNIPSLYKGTIPTLSSVLHNTKIHNNEPSKESSSWSHDDLTPLSLDCQDQKETLHVALTDLTDWLQSEKQAQAHFLKEETIEELLPYHTSIEDDIPSADTLISLFDATDRRMDMNDYDFELFP